MVERHVLEVAADVQPVPADRQRPLSEDRPKRIARARERSGRGVERPSESPRRGRKGKGRELIASELYDRKRVVTKPVYSRLNEGLPVDKWEFGIESVGFSVERI